MANSFRINQIYSELIKSGKSSVDDLAAQFNVTATTIRRDLLILEEQGLIYRTRGYACVLDSDDSSQAGIFDDERKQIANAALKFFKEYVKSKKTASLEMLSVAMDSGRTVQNLCEGIAKSSEFHGLNVVTHSLTAALSLGKDSAINVSMPGGAVFQGALVGIDVTDFYKEIKTDLAFLGSTGIKDCHGLTVSHPLQLSVKKQAVSCAGQRIALLDSSKYLQRGIYIFCDFRDVDKVITVETEDNKPQLGEISHQGVDIILA